MYMGIDAMVETAYVMHAMLPPCSCPAIASLYTLDMSTPFECSQVTGVLLLLLLLRPPAQITAMVEEPTEDLR